MQFLVGMYLHTCQRYGYTVKFVLPMKSVVPVLFLVINYSLFELSPRSFQFNVHVGTHKTYIKLAISIAALTISVHGKLLLIRRRGKH